MPRRASFPAVETIRYVYTPEFTFTEKRPPGRAPTAIDDERRDLLDSLIQALKTGGGDPDCFAVCCGLLQHLGRMHPRTG